MTSPESLDPAQLDALREVANIGAGHAATALAEMTRRPVLITVPRVSAMRLAEAADEIGPALDPHAAVALEIVGDLTGRTLLLLDRRSARALVDILLNRDESAARADDGPPRFDPTESSALEELGNILTSAYASALSDFLGLVLLPSVPRLRIGPLGEVLAGEDPAGSRRGGAVICVETRFRFRNTATETAGHFILIPDAGALPVLLAAVRSRP